MLARAEDGTGDDFIRRIIAAGYVYGQSNAGHAAPPGEIRFVQIRFLIS